MPNYNKVQLMGHLTKDPVTRTVNTGPVTDFGIAVSRKYKSKSGAQNEEVLFIDCTAWGRTGEVIAEYLTKGKPIFIEGRLKLDQWEDKNGGGKRSKHGVTVESFQFVGGNKSGETKSAERDNYDDAPIDSGDIPF